MKRWNLLDMGIKFEICVMCMDTPSDGIIMGVIFLENYCKKLSDEYAALILNRQVSVHMLI